MHTREWMTTELADPGAGASMHINIYVYIHTYTQIYIHIYTHLYAHTRVDDYGARGSRRWSELACSNVRVNP